MGDDQASGEVHHAVILRRLSGPRRRSWCLGARARRVGGGRWEPNGRRGMGGVEADGSRESESPQATKEPMVSPAHTCPHCGSRLRKWRVPDGATWSEPFFFVCFDDTCPYYREGWTWMKSKFNHIHSSLGNLALETRVAQLIGDSGLEQNFRIKTRGWNCILWLDLKYLVAHRLRNLRIFAAICRAFLPIYISR